MNQLVCSAWLIQYNNLRSKMNPENVGPNISLRHSAIWRKPLIYEKPQYKLPLCHQQLNQSGKTGDCWRTRNNPVRNSTNLHKPRKPLKEAPLKDNQLRVSQQVETQAGSKSKKLCESMVKLKSQGLSEGGKPVLAAYPGVGRFSWVINDYHPFVSNPSFSRNEKGKHFTS